MVEASNPLPTLHQEDVADLVAEVIIAVEDVAMVVAQEDAATATTSGELSSKVERLTLFVVRSVRSRTKQMNAGIGLRKTTNPR